MDYYELDDPVDPSVSAADQGAHWDDPLVDEHHYDGGDDHVEPLPADDPDDQTGGPHGRAVWVDTDGDGDYDKRLVDRDGDGDWDNVGPGGDGSGRHR